MSKDITIIRIDPHNKAVAALVLKARKDHAADIKHLVRSKSIGWFELCTIGNVRMTETRIVDGEEKKFDLGAAPLMVAARDVAPRDLPGWRLTARETSTAGEAVLFGMSPAKRIIDCPVDADWIRENIVWLSAEECVASEDTEQRIEI